MKARFAFISIFPLFHFCFLHKADYFIRLNRYGDAS